MMFWLAIMMVLNMNWGKRDPKGIKSKVEGDSFVWFNIQCVARIGLSFLMKQLYFLATTIDTRYSTSSGVLSY